MPPGKALDLPLGVEQLVVEVDVRPPQSECFALPEAHPDTDAPPHEGGLLGRRLKECLGLLLRERVRLCLVDCRRIHQGGHVFDDEATAVRDFQGAGQDAVHLEHMGRRVPLVEHDAVHPLKVLRL
jgi:hypothetical protein